MSCSLSLGSAPPDEGVRDDDAARAGSRRRGRRGSRSIAAPHDGLVRAGEGFVGHRRQGVPREVGVQVRDAVDGHRAVGVVDEHRVGRGVRARRGCARAASITPDTEAEPRGGVVVARGDAPPSRSAARRSSTRGEHADGVDRRDRAVVDVAGDDDEVDRALHDEVDEVVEEGGLVLEQVGTRAACGRGASRRCAGCACGHGNAAPADIPGHRAGALWRTQAVSAAADGQCRAPRTTWTLTRRGARERSSCCRGSCGRRRSYGRAEVEEPGAGEPGSDGHRAAVGADDAACPFISVERRTARSRRRVGPSDRHALSTRSACRSAR